MIVYDNAWTANSKQCDGMQISETRKTVIETAAALSWIDQINGTTASFQT